jgi:formaldehyde-activating enzyme involved in methanogenesis
MGNCGIKSRPKIRAKIGQKHDPLTRDIAPDLDKKPLTFPINPVQIFDDDENRSKLCLAQDQAAKWTCHGFVPLL